MPDGVGVDLAGPGPVTVKPTYALQPADSEYRFGWHYCSMFGPVIFTVMMGTLILRRRHVLRRSTSSRATPIYLSRPARP